MSSSRAPSGTLHGIAGSLSSVVSLALFYPLDQLRTLQQLGLAPRKCSSDILRSQFGNRLGSLIELVNTEGISGLYCGLTPSLFALAISNYVFYYTFHSLKRFAENLRTSKARFSSVTYTREASVQRRTLENLLTSALAGVINVLLTNPLWVAATLIKRSQHQREVRNKEVCNEGSALHKFSPYDHGDESSLNGTNALPYPTVLYDDTKGKKDQYMSSIYSPFKGSCALLGLYEANSRSSNVSGSSYTAELYGHLRAPAERETSEIGIRESLAESFSERKSDVDTQTTSSTLNDSPEPSVVSFRSNSSGVLGLILLLRRICQEKGVAYLWKGTIASLILVSNPIIQFAFYEGIKRVVLLRYRAQRSSKHHRAGRHRNSSVEAMPYSLSATEGFFLGAVSKSIATCATYPLQIAQARLRAASSRPPNGMATTSETIDPTSSTVACLKSLYQSGGVTALFDGLETKLMQSVATSALMFSSYESILGLISRTGIR